MSDIRHSILATLAYYDIFDYPLTSTELHRYLVNPARLSGKFKGAGEIKFSNLTSEISKLLSQNKIQAANGFYSLPGRAPGLYAMRTEKEKVSASKFKKLLRAARWFQAVPYLRGIFVSGSLALSNSNPKGDFDVLVVMRAGRLYTARLLLSLLASLLRVRRGRHDKEAPDKFCFNHYITDGLETIPHRSIYTAYNYAQLVPVLSLDDNVGKFFTANIWINQYLYNFRPDMSSGIRRVKPSGFLAAVRVNLEKLLNGKWGDKIENAARSYQQRRIRLNPVTGQPGGRIIFTDTQLEFHPRSFESTVIKRYNENLKRLTIILPSPEKDSGLARTP